MDKSLAPQLQIVPTTEATGKIVLMCGAFGAFVSAGAYLLVRGVAGATIDNVNALLREQHVMDVPSNDI